MNNLIKKWKDQIEVKTGRAGLVIQKHLPEIELAAGIAGLVVTGIMIYKAGTKAQAIVENHSEEMNKIEQAKELAEQGEVVYTEDEIKADKVNVYLHTALDFAKTIWPSALVGASSLALILMSHNTLNKRYLGAISAFNGVTEAFKVYRKNVKDRFGEEVDYELKNGIVKAVEMVETKDEKGKKKTEEVTVTKFDPNAVSNQAVWFKEGCDNWDPYPPFNIAFLKAQQAMLTEKLRTKGHLFLNEVYDALGLSDTQEGAMVGWILGMGDNCVDFGLYEDRNASFINGDENKILLDFNHDGIIWDKI